MAAGAASGAAACPMPVERTDGGDCAGAACGVRIVAKASAATTATTAVSRMTWNILVTKLRLKPPSDDLWASRRTFVTRRPQLRQLLKPKTCFIRTVIGFRIIGFREDVWEPWEI